MGIQTKSLHMNDWLDDLTIQNCFDLLDEKTHVNLCFAVVQVNIDEKHLR